MNMRSDAVEHGNVETASTSLKTFVVDDFSPTMTTAPVVDACSPTMGAKRQKVQEPLVQMGYFGYDGDDPKRLKSFLVFVKVTQGQSDSHISSVFGAGTTITGLGNL